MSNTEEACQALMKKTTEPNVETEVKKEVEPTLTIIFADQSQREVSLPWLKTHSKMIETMFESGLGLNKRESITLANVRNSKQFDQIKSTIKGDLTWLLDPKIKNKDLGSLYLDIWHTLNYLDVEISFDWTFLDKYTVKDVRIMKILFLLDLLLDSSDRYKKKIQSLVWKLLESADQQDLFDWEKSFHSIVSGLTLVGREVIDLRLTLDRIFQESSPILEVKPYQNKLDLNPQFIPRLKEMAGSAWPWARNLKVKNYWPKGMILSGGAVITCCTDRDKSKIDPSEDLDFWIYGPSKEERKARFQAALKYLIRGVEKEVIFSANSCVVTIILPGDKVRMVQLVYTDQTSPEGVVNRFDLGYVKCYYDGSCLYGTDEARIALELGIVDFDPNQIKPERLYKLFRYPFTFQETRLFSPILGELSKTNTLFLKVANNPDFEDSSVEDDASISKIERQLLVDEITIMEQLEIRFGLYSIKGVKTESNENLKEISNESIYSEIDVWPRKIQQLVTQLNSYDSVQRLQQKYVHLPKGLDAKREKFLIGLILRGNFITKSLDQVCENMVYQPFPIQNYDNDLQITGDGVPNPSSGLLIDFSQIPLVYQAQIDRIIPRMKYMGITCRSVCPIDGGHQVNLRLTELDEPMVIRFRNLVVKCSSLEKNYINGKTVLSAYAHCIDKYGGPLINTLISLNERLLNQVMLEDGYLKNSKHLGFPKDYCINPKVGDPSVSYPIRIIHGAHRHFLQKPTSWELGFRVSNPHVIHGEISQSMIVDLDLIFKGWVTSGNRHLGCRKTVKNLIIRQNLSPILKPGKEAIGQPWKKLVIPPVPFLN